MPNGCEQLQDWLSRRGFNQREAANYLSVSESVFGKILRGTRQPGLLMAMRIERLTGIPAEVWVASRLDKTNGSVPEAAANMQEDKV